MSISVEWDGESRQIIRYTFDEMWSIAEFVNATAEGTAMMLSRSQRVYNICLFPKHIRLPRDFFLAMHKVEKTMPDNLGLGIVVGGGQFTRGLYGIVARMVPNLGNKIRLADSLEEARQIVEEREATYYERELVPEM